MKVQLIFELIHQIFLISDSFHIDSEHVIMLDPYI